MIKKILNFNLILAFLFNAFGPLPAKANELVLLIPGAMVSLSPEFTPAHLKGITIHPDNALQFDFIIHKGDSSLSEAQKQEEYKKLIKYFLASLAVPDENQWVNLSPYEKDRIIKEDFGKTEMGRDLLSQDYLLKQITASLIYPEQGLGQKFWDKVYEQAYKQYGNTNIPVNTFNKVWIVPDNAVIYEKGNTAYVLKNHLKVMLEEDYLALQKSSVGAQFIAPTKEGSMNRTPTDTHSLASNIVREIVLPALEKEVNEGKNFAMLRQVYSGMILAAWYKRALKESLLAKIYADKAKLKGLSSPNASVGDPGHYDIEGIYQRYLTAFKKGVYNYIKEDIDKYTHQVIPRKYFSGGTKGFEDFAQIVKETRSIDLAQAAEIQNGLSKEDMATVALEEFREVKQLNSAPRDAAMTLSRDPNSTIHRIVSMAEIITKAGDLKLAERLLDELSQDLEKMSVKALMDKWNANYPLLRAEDIAPTDIPLLQERIETMRLDISDKENETHIEELRQTLGEERFQIITFLLTAKSHGRSYKIAQLYPVVIQRINRFVELAGDDTMNAYWESLDDDVQGDGALQPLVELAELESRARDYVARMLSEEDVRTHIPRLADPDALRAAIAEEQNDYRTFQKEEKKIEFLIKFFRSKGFNNIADQLQETLFVPVTVEQAKTIAVQALQEAGDDLKDLQIRSINRKETVESILYDLRSYVAHHTQGKENDARIIRTAVRGIESEYFPDGGLIMTVPEIVREWVLGTLWEIEQDYGARGHSEIPDYSSEFNDLITLREILQRVNMLKGGRSRFMFHFRNSVRADVRRKLMELRKRLTEMRHPGTAAVKTGRELARFIGDVPFSDEHKMDALSTENPREMAIWNAISRRFTPDVADKERHQRVHAAVKAINEHFATRDISRMSAAKILNLMLPRIKQEYRRSRGVNPAMTSEHLEDQAMVNLMEEKTPFGGIDMNAANLNLQIKRDGKGVPLPLPQQDLEHIRIDGLVPIILEIKPALATPLLSELQVAGAQQAKI